MGLSPRVRGNRTWARVGNSGNRSIPACAGEPRELELQLPQTTVYPRVCGGTDRMNQKDFAALGLSPRVRGNQSAKLRYLIVSGSIPACAGEPPSPPRTAARPRVYPRVCGGTARVLIHLVKNKGLSPRVRGNHHLLATLGVFVGSIPACAGEPKTASATSGCPRVYPRVCGGTQRLLFWANYA